MWRECLDLAGWSAVSATLVMSADGLRVAVDGYHPSDAGRQRSLNQDWDVERQLSLATLGDDAPLGKGEVWLIGQLIQSLLYGDDAPSVDPVLTGLSDALPSPARRAAQGGLVLRYVALSGAKLDHHTVVSMFRMFLNTKTGNAFPELAAAVSRYPSVLGNLPELAEPRLYLDPATADGSAAAAADITIGVLASLLAGEQHAVGADLDHLRHLRLGIEATMRVDGNWYQYQCPHSAQNLLAILRALHAHLR